MVCIRKVQKNDIWFLKGNFEILININGKNILFDAGIRQSASKDSVLDFSDVENTLNIISGEEKFERIKEEFEKVTACSLVNN